jgi:uncharacterized membrane protein YdjX (TVP38/TMEM64 family)
LSVVRWILVVGVLAVAAFLAVRFSEGNRLTEEDIHHFVSSYGVAAPLVFIVLFAVTGSLLVPTTVLTIVGATLFGPHWGFFYSVVGAFLAAMLGFMVARTLGRRFVSRWLERAPGRLARLDRRLEKHGFTTALFMRLLYLPNGLINLVCGVSAIPVAVYAGGTILGIIPMAFAVTYMAAGISQALLTGDWSALERPETILGGGLFVCCLTVPWLISRIRKRQQGRRQVESMFGEEAAAETNPTQKPSPGGPA